MDRKQLRRLINSYLKTVDDKKYDEWYVTNKRIHTEGLEGFLRWLTIRKKKGTKQKKARGS